VRRLMGHDTISGCFWLAFAVFIISRAVSYGVGSFSRPAPGSFLFMSGILLGALCLLLIINSIVEKKHTTRISELWRGLDWKTAAGVFVALFVYNVLLPILGYLLTSFLLLTLLLSVTRRREVLTNIIYALLITFLSYLLFERLLDVSFPKGFVGF
jgi:putative tricarboxylic transport membrane protein